jgi:hypothetical protein
MASNGKIRAKRLKKQLAKTPAALPPRPAEVCRLEVISSGYGDTTRAPATDDRWDRGDTSTHWVVSGLRLTNRAYGDVTADFEVKPGDVLYLVYAIYSTGDSFGRDTNARIEYITVHKDYEIAKANEQVLRGKTSSRNKRGDYEWSVNLQTDSGIVFPYHVPWLGYFESLSDIYIESYTVEQAKS